MVLGGYALCINGSIAGGQAVSDDDAIRVRLDVLVRLVGARLQAGEPTTAAVPSVRSAAAGMGLPNVLITTAARTVWAEYVTADGAAHSRMAACRSLDALDCDASKRLDRITKAAAVAVTWTLLVPLPHIVGWVADAAGSEHLAAVARASSALLVVSGIVIGGTLVIAGADRLGFEPAQNWQLPTLAIPLGLLFAVLGAMANAVANGGGLDLLGPAAVIGLATAACNQTLIHVLGVPSAWAAAIAAVLLGIGASLWSRRIPYPGSVLALMGITGALLPGLTVYQGLAAELGHHSGVSPFATAAAVCFGLGVGVTFGMTLTDRAMTVRRRATAIAL